MPSSATTGLTGKDVRFLTGMDEHSANVERLGTERGTEPRTLVDEWAANWQAGFDRFDISYDRFIRTTDPDHREASVEMVRRAQASGDIYKGTYAGWYCTGDNEFKTESQIVDGKCPDHPTLELQWLEEENWFFALSKYQGALEELYRTNPSFCEPEHFRNEVLGWLADGLQDFSVSRSGTGWGIPFPGDEEHRIYVWFDALTNYVTGAGFPGDAAAFEKWWPADVHVIGKNITRFHCLYWPAMLMSAGLPLPRQVFAHGFMLMRGEKMSKTRGNILDPDQALATFGVDGVRYLVLREIPFDRDGDVTADGMIRRYNADLANDLGNLVNRTVSMADRYLDGTLPDLAGIGDGPSVTDADAELQRVAARGGGRVPDRRGAAPFRRGAPRAVHVDARRERLRRVAGSLGPQQGRGERARGRGAGHDGGGVPDPGPPARAVLPDSVRQSAPPARDAAPVRRPWRRRPGPGCAPGLGRRGGRATNRSAVAAVPPHRGRTRWRLRLRRGDRNLSRLVVPERLPGIVDAHAHLQHEVFAHDLDAVLDRARAAGLTRILVPGWDRESSEAAIALADRHPELLDAAVGIHPHYVAAATEADWTAIEALAAEPRAMAVGEIGLDFHRNLSPPDVQRDALARQLDLAARVRKPVVVHDREAHDEVTAALIRHAAQINHAAQTAEASSVPGILHAFSGDAEMAASARRRRLPDLVRAAGQLPEEPRSARGGGRRPGHAPPGRDRLPVPGYRQGPAQRAHDRPAHRRRDCPPSRRGSRERRRRRGHRVSPPHIVS